MSTRKLITCNNAIEAHLVQGRLAEEGIQSILAGEIMRNYPPTSGVNVLVREQDYQRAIEIIASK
jgi:hypothetical protein